MKGDGFLRIKNTGYSLYLAHLLVKPKEMQLGYNWDMDWAIIGIWIGL
jgi:hypothetical protein